jgi:hypothetical protein
MNPARTKRTDYRPARVTVAVLVHIPHLTGYFEHRWPVLRACLASIEHNTHLPYDLLVFDNASCPPIRDYLLAEQERGAIQFLLRSATNLGKIGAFRILFRAAPGEVVAYCDDDFHFEPGWLAAQLAILDTFPHVGMVSGYVIPSFFDDERISANRAFAEDPGVESKRGKFIADGWIRDWAISTGRDPAQAIQAARPIEELVLTYQGVEAFAAANHDQFVAPKQVIVSALPEAWSGRLMGEMLELDERINRLGYLRLATAARTSRHLGNVLPPDLAGGTHTAAVGEPGESRSGLSVKARFLRWKPIRAVLLGIYSHLFGWINPE